jgi:hypothetical protein
MTCFYLKIILRTFFLVFVRFHVYVILLITCVICEMYPVNFNSLVHLLETRLF